MSIATRPERLTCEHFLAASKQSSSVQSSLEGADPAVAAAFGPEQRLDMTITERPRPLFLTSLDSLDSSVISQPDTARAVGTILPCADDMLCLLESHDEDISRMGSLASARELSLSRRLETGLELEAAQLPLRRATPEPLATPLLSRAPSGAPPGAGDALSSRGACASVLAHVDLLVTRLQSTDRRGGAAHPPHCVEPGPETLQIIRKILEQFPYTAAPQKGGARGSHGDGRARMRHATDDMARLYVPLALLRLLKVNLDWMAKGGGGEERCDFRGGGEAGDKGGGEEAGANRDDGEPAGDAAGAGGGGPGKRRGGADVASAVAGGGCVAERAAHLLAGGNARLSVRLFLRSSAQQALASSQAVICIFVSGKRTLLILIVSVELNEERDLISVWPSSNDRNHVRVPEYSD